MIEFLRKWREPNSDDSHYQDRISGPLLDRIDMQIEVPALPPDTLSAVPNGDSTAVIAERVRQAHARQLARQDKSNQQLNTRAIDRYCKLDAQGEETLRHAMHQLHWSARAYYRVLKVARTIADVEASDTISAEHVAEAIGYRRGLRERA